MQAHGGTTDSLEGYAGQGYYVSRDSAAELLQRRSQRTQYRHHKHRSGAGSYGPVKLPKPPTALDLPELIPEKEPEPRKLRRQHSGLKLWKPTPRELDSAVKRAERVREEFAVASTHLDPATRHDIEKEVKAREDRVNLVLQREIMRLERGGATLPKDPMTRFLIAEERAEEVRHKIDRVEAKGKVDYELNQERIRNNEALKGGTVAGSNLARAHLKEKERLELLQEQREQAEERHKRSQKSGAETVVEHAELAAYHAAQVRQSIRCSTRASEGRRLLPLSLS